MSDTRAAFNIYISGNRGNTPDATADTYKDAEKASQALADATGLHVRVYPCLERYALIPNWTAYPSR